MVNFFLFGCLFWLGIAAFVHLLAFLLKDNRTLGCKINIKIKMKKDCLSLIKKVSPQNETQTVKKIVIEK